MTEKKISKKVAAGLDMMGLGQYNSNNAEQSK
jgi:hypothetical protein